MARAAIAPVRQERTDQADAYRSLFVRSTAGIAVLDLALRVRGANEQFEDLAGSRGAMGRNLLEFLDRGSHARLRSQFVRLVSGRRDRVVERVRGVRADDQVLLGTLAAVAVRGPGPMVSTIVVTLQWEERPNGASTGGAQRRRRVLTEMDARILEGIAIGMSTVELATKLYMSRQGVEYHVGTMLKKLKAPNRAALVSRAYSMGLLGSDVWPPRVASEFIH